MKGDEAAKQCAQDSSRFSPAVERGRNVAEVSAFATLGSHSSSLVKLTHHLLVVCDLFVGVSLVLDTAGLLAIGATLRKAFRKNERKMYHQTLTKVDERLQVGPVSFSSDGPRYAL